jgi:SulP family sulfate permease
MAGLTVAIAAGVRPERGIFTATVGGFLVSALGGSPFQIGGPVGAFIVLVANALARLGVAGLATAVALSGAGLGVLRLGRLIPHPVTLGF